MILFLIFIGSLFLLMNMIIILRIIITYIEQSYQDQREAEVKKIDLSVYNKIT